MNFYSWLNLILLLSDLRLNLRFFLCYSPFQETRFLNIEIDLCVATFGLFANINYISQLCYSNAVWAKLRHPHYWKLVQVISFAKITLYSSNLDNSMAAAILFAVVYAFMWSWIKLNFRLTWKLLVLFRNNI